MTRNCRESGILTFQKQYLRRKSDKLTAKNGPHKLHMQAVPWIPGTFM